MHLKRKQSNNKNPRKINVWHPVREPIYEFKKIFSTFCGLNVNRSDEAFSFKTLTKKELREEPICGHCTDIINNPRRSTWAATGYAPN